MIIVWGSRTLTLTIGDGSFICPKCRTPHKFRHRLHKRFFTLYYIPIFPIGDGPDFVECAHCQGTFRPELLRYPAAEVKYQRRYPLLIVYGSIFALMTAFMIFTSIQEQQNAWRAEQAAIAVANTKAAYTASFGAVNLELCKSTRQISNWNIPTNAHILFFNNESHEIAIPYQEQLPSEKRASSSTDVTHIVCLTPNSVEYSRDEYGEKNSEVVVYTCTRYIRYFDAYVVEVETGKTVAYHRFPGSMPATCPDSVRSSLSYYGELPTPADMVENLQSDAGDTTQLATS